MIAIPRTDDKGALPSQVNRMSKDRPENPTRHETKVPQPEHKEADGTPAQREIGGPKGPEPTRYGDWEKAGRCIDF